MIQWDWGKRWWAVSSAKADEEQGADKNGFQSWPRPVVLLLVVGATLGVTLLLDWFNGWPLWNALFDPDIRSEAGVRFFSALVYALALVLGLPVAFLVWHWRDRNKRDEIENARKDVNLKEFQEVAARASGALDVNLPKEAREVLQIAAIHQLRGFLRGEYGDGFRRPAFELLMAGHEAAMERIGVPAVQAQIGKLADKSRLFAEIRKAAEDLRKKLDPVDRARMLVMKEEAAAIFSGTFPLSGRRFDLLDLNGKLGKGVAPRGLDLTLSSWFGAYLWGAYLEGANLRFAHLEGANLLGANLEGADLRHANLKGTFLGGSNLEGAALDRVNLEEADLTKSNLKRADFGSANLEGASLYGADLQGAKFWLPVGKRLLGELRHQNADLSGTMFDDDTELASGWRKLSREERKKYQDQLRALGARHVDDPEPDDERDGDA